MMTLGGPRPQPPLSGIVPELECVLVPLSHDAMRVVTHLANVVHGPE